MSDVSAPFRIAVVGDVHLCWNAADVAYFNDSSYDLIVFVGDVATYNHRRSIATLRSIAELRPPTLFVPGNHDGVHLMQLASEVFGWSRVSDLLAPTQRRRCAELRDSLGRLPVAAYSLHRLSAPGTELTLLTGRPHSMGGTRLAFRRYLQTEFGVSSLADSARKLEEMVDRSPTETVIFVAHNGPTGLGPSRSDIWGCDFRREEGDFGDPDLRQAIDYAKGRGKRVLAVVAGHMHHRLKGGGHRRWLVEEDGTLYVNVARVPRTFERDGRRLHHHVRLEIEGASVAVTEQLVPMQE